MHLKQERSIWKINHYFRPLQPTNQSPPSRSPAESSKDFAVVGSSAFVAYFICFMLIYSLSVYTVFINDNVYNNDNA